MSPDREHRRFPRHPLEVEIQAGDATVDGELLFDSHNVSEGGVFLLSDLLLEVGDTLWLSFELPGTPLAIRTRGRVVWVNRHPDENDPSDRAGMGVKFLDLSETEHAALAEYLRDEGPPSDAIGT